MYDLPHASHSKIRDAFGLNENCRELPNKTTKKTGEKFTGDEGPFTPNKPVKGEKIEVNDKFTNEVEKNSKLFPKKFESKTKYESCILNPHSIFEAATNSIVTMNHQDYQQFLELLKAIYHEAPFFGNLAQHATTGAVAKIDMLLQKTGLGSFSQLTADIKKFVLGIKNKFTSERGVWGEGIAENSPHLDLEEIIHHLKEINTDLINLRTLILRYKAQFDAHDVFTDITRLTTGISKFLPFLADKAGLARMKLIPPHQQHPDYKKALISKSQVPPAPVRPNQKPNPFLKPFAL